MIRIVSSILLSDLDSNPGIWTQIPIIPGTCKYKDTTSHTDSGWLRSVSLEFRVHQVIPEMTRNLALVVRFDDGSHVHVGTEELPVRLELKQDGHINVSCEWRCSAR